MQLISNFVFLPSHAHRLFRKQLRVWRYDGRPLGSEDLLYSAVIEVTQRSSHLGSSTTTTVTLPVPEDGNVHLEIPVMEEAEMLLIRVGIDWLLMIAPWITFFGLDYADFLPLWPTVKPDQIITTLYQVSGFTYLMSLVHVAPVFCLLQGKVSICRGDTWGHQQLRLSQWLISPDLPSQLSTGTGHPGPALCAIISYRITDGLKEVNFQIMPSPNLWF